MRAANAAAEPVAPRRKRVTALKQQQRCITAQPRCVTAQQQQRRCVIPQQPSRRCDVTCPRAGFRGLFGQCNGGFRHYDVRHSCLRAEMHTMPTEFGEHNRIGGGSPRPERVCYVQNQAYLASRPGYIRPAILPVDNTASTGNTSAADDADDDNDHRTFGNGRPANQGVLSKVEIQFGTPSEAAVL